VDIALGQIPRNILRQRQKIYLGQNLAIPASQKTLEIAIVLEPSQSPLCLNGTVHTQQPAFIRRNFFQRALSLRVEFPA
jgi:hypothetical protein